MKQPSLNDTGTLCPDCKKAKVHVGQEHFQDGLYLVEYCKECGFRAEKPLKERA